MALTAQNSIAASLLRRSLNRQTAIAQSRLKFQPKQVENTILLLVEQQLSVQYNELVRVLKECPLNDENFKCVFEDCLSCVVLLGRNLSPLVNVLCDIEWLGRSEELVDLYRRFLISLVTAHTYHCPYVMISLVKLFYAKGEIWEDSPSEDQVTRWSNIHTVIAQIVAIMPMTSDLLLRTVVEQFPYYKAGSFANRSYVHNLIWMGKYLPALRENIMVAIINRMIVMDVNIVEREKNKIQTETQFEMDITESDDIQQSLDFSMLEVLQWLEEERDPAFNIICNIFERVILPTYGIRHVQFLLLYTISISQQCADRTLTNLWEVAAGHQALGPGALATRRTAASHLAGLLARCVRIPNSRLVHYLKLMTDWCHSYITAAQESSTSTNNLKAHGAFHAVCHAVFYLVAFKHHYLFSSKEMLSFVQSLGLSRVVSCSLNPLRACPAGVARVFAGVTRAHQLVYCQPVIDRNLRHDLLAADHIHQDDWFPYDPYTLPRSGKKIWPLCIEYKDWLNECDDETQYTGMKKKLDPEDDDFLMASSPSQRLASLSNTTSAGFRTSETILM